MACSQHISFAMRCNFDLWGLTMNQMLQILNLQSAVSNRNALCQSTIWYLYKRMFLPVQFWYVIKGTAFSPMRYGTSNDWATCWLVSLCDNGAISSVIQPTNQSRVPSSRPRTDVRPKGKDTRSNPEHKVERKRWVPTPCSITMLCNPTRMW